MTKSPRLYVLFRIAVPRIILVTRLPSGVCAKWCGACHPIAVTFSASTSQSGQKDTSACELVTSAAGSNIYTLTTAL